MAALIPLNFPAYPLRIRTTKGNQEIFDAARRKWVRLTPEEWVRQHLMMYFHLSLEIPLSMMAVEKSISVNGLSKRFDLVVYKNSQPIMLVECKAPGVLLEQSAMDQAGRYNMVMGVPYLCISNGLSHYFCKKSEASDSWVFLESIPAFSNL
jgi:predicted type IV restriction endonuclease